MRRTSARNQKHAEHASHERWLVSYADFITLLFAFFVVMFASSQVDKKKVGSLAAYFGAYIQDGNARAAALAVEKPGSDAASERRRRLATAGELEPVEAQLAQDLAPEIAGGKVALALQPRGLVLSLREAALFAPGQDLVSPEALPLLSKIAGALQKLPEQQVRLEGHTDDVPIQTEKFPSNWELSAARANAVLDLFCERLGLPPERFAIAGYAEHHPMAPNDTPENRAHNRRVDIVILSSSAAEMEPRQQGGDG